MQEKINFQGIPAFRYLSAKGAEIVSTFFESQIRKKDEKILSYGMDVPGLYIVQDGFVNVHTEQSEKPIARIDEGGAFGEMSLIEEGQKSSAHIVVGSETARLQFCERSRFAALLKTSDSIALAFYRGAAELVSRRLRSTNEAMGKQLDMAQKIMSENSEHHQLGYYLGQTRSTLNDSGSNVVGQLLGIALELDGLGKQLGNERSQVEDIAKRLESLVLLESQNFDVMSQQLDLIMQFFNNMRRVIKGEEPVEVRGDLKLLRT